MGCVGCFTIGHRLYSMKRRQIEKSNTTRPLIDERNEAEENRWEFQQIRWIHGGVDGNIHELSIDDNRNGARPAAAPGSVVL